MSIIPQYPHILHGGDYNPDQWLQDAEIIDQDFQLMSEAHCNAFSVGIFSWSQLEPEEGDYHFQWLDDIMDRCQRAGSKVFLATPSAARPAWLAERYPETDRVSADGRPLPWGGRQNFCRSSAVYREKLGRLIGLLAERYAHHPALGGWHISNEYVGECHCPRCRQRFVEFLKRRYGTLDKLNECYWSAFWGHRFSAWEQVNPLDQSMDLAMLDQLRFNTEQIADLMRFEISCVRKFSSAPVTTNMMGSYTPIDYGKLAPLCDFISDDCYPGWYKGETEAVAAHYSMLHDMHYAMKDKPFAMLESCPGIPTYKPYCKLRRPGELQREMIMALGHGCDATMYFQWRKGRGNCEKFHGAVVGHDGTNQTHCFQSVADYGRHIAALDELVDSRMEPEVAVIYDFESIWALQTTAAFGKVGATSNQRIPSTIFEHYQALWTQNLSLAVVESTAELSRYKLVVAPMLYMLKPGVKDAMEAYVRQGGQLVLTYLSAYVDEHNLCFKGGSPGGWAMRELVGVWSEDIDLFEPAIQQELHWQDGALRGRKDYQVLRRCELLHASEDTQVLAVYGCDFYAGTPAVTCRQVGKGRIYYLGADTETAFLQDFYGSVAEQAGAKPVLSGLPQAVKASRRVKGDCTYYFLLNMTEEAQEVKLPVPMEDIWSGGGDGIGVTLPPRGSTILRQHGRD